MTLNIGTALFSTSIKGIDQIVEEQFGKETSGYLNSVFGLGYAGYGVFQGVKNGDKNTAQMSMVAILKSALKLLTQIGINSEAAEARREVKENSDKADKVNEDAKALEEKLNSAISSFSDRLNLNDQKIQSAISTITDAQATMEEKQNAINRMLLIIQALQEELKSAKTPEEQKEILTSIKDTSLAINDLIAFLPDLQATMEEADEIINEATEAKELLQQEATVVEQEVTTAITETVAEGTEAIVANAETATEGATNTTNSAIAGAGAVAAAATPATAAKAPQLTKTSVDEGTAAATRLPSIVTCLGKLATGLGTNSENTNLLATFKNAVGSALNAHIESFGAYNSLIQPMLTSIGSIQSVQTTTATINSAVNTDLGTIDSRGSVVIQNSNPYVSSLTPISSNNLESNPFSTDLLTPNVEIKLMDIATKK